MDKYISRDKVIELITEDKVRMDDNTLLVAAAIGGSYSAIDCFHAINDTCDRHINSVKEIPEADVAPVVHGKWIDEGQYADYHPQHALRCSVCGDHIIVCLGDETNYCSYCGARMME